MKYDVDEMLKEMYQKEVRPDSILNQRTLRKMMTKERGGMKKTWNYKKVAVAAAMACVVLTGGVGVTYAAVNHISLLSLFRTEDSSVKEKAKDLLETDVKQDTASNKEQSKYAVFSVKEAICDKNTIHVQTAAKPASKDYLLVPSELWGDLDKEPIANLNIAGVSDTSMSIQKYAEKMHKKCIMVDMGIKAKASSQSLDYAMDEDGTLVYTFTFENVEQTDQLTYACDTIVDASEAGAKTSEIKDSFQFTLKDASGETETLCYTADSKKAIPGTDLVLDDVEITNSALETKCVVNYHTIDLEAKEWDKWINTKDSDLSFYLLDEDGNVIDVKESSGMEASEKNGGRIQQDIYPLQELPEKLTFLVKDCMTKEEIGTVTVTRK